MKRKKKIPAALRGSVWNKYIGEEYGRGECYICCGMITQGTFACGHIIAEAKGGEIILENLRPICTRCNSSQGTENMDDFIEKYKLQNAELGKEEKKEKEKNEGKKEKKKKKDNGKKEYSKIKLKDLSIDSSRRELILDNLCRLSIKEMNIMDNKHLFGKYKTQWYGIENYLNGGIFAPRKSKMRILLTKFTKKMLLLLCGDLHIPCTGSKKKTEIVELILLYRK